MCLVDELCETVKEARSTAKPAAKNKATIVAKEWPKDIVASMASVQDMQPPGATLWFDPRLQRYQVFLRGQQLQPRCQVVGTKDSRQGVHPLGVDFVHDDERGCCLSS